MAANVPGGGWGALAPGDDHGRAGVGNLQDPGGDIFDADEYANQIPPC